MKKGAKSADSIKQKEALYTFTCAKSSKAGGYEGGPKKLTAHYYYSGRSMKNLYLTFVTNFIFSVLFLLSAQLRLPLFLRLL